MGARNRDMSSHRFLGGKLGKLAPPLGRSYLLVMMILRIVGGAMGVLLMLGSAFAQGELATLCHIGIALFGLVMVLVATFANNKNVERWFGGL